MEFKFLWNRSRNEWDGMPVERDGTESLQNHCLLMMPKSSVGVCQCSIWASSTNNTTLPQPPPSYTTPTHLAHHRHQRPPPTTTQNSQTPPGTGTACPNTARTMQQCHVTTQSSQTSAWSIAQQCHIAVSDVANNEQ